MIHQTQGGLKKWKSDSFLAEDDSVNDHHIFPKKYIQSFNDEYASKLCNSVVNRTWITEITNKEIGAKKPSEYIKLLKNKQIDECLKTHLIPEGFGKEEYNNKFEDFMHERAKSIFKLIQENTKI